MPVLQKGLKSELYYDSGTLHALFHQALDKMESKEHPFLASNLMKTLDKLTNKTI